MRAPASEVTETNAFSAGDTPAAVTTSVVFEADPVKEQLELLPAGQGAIDRRRLVAAHLHGLPATEQPTEPETELLLNRLSVACSASSDPDPAALWPGIFLTWQMENRHVLAARRALLRRQQPREGAPDPLATMDMAEPLAVEVQTHLSAADSTDALATFAETKGWAADAAQLRKISPSTDPIRLPALLALMLWTHELRPELERADRKLPALVVQVHETVTDILSHSIRPLDRGSQQLLLLDGEPRARMRYDQVPTIDDAAMTAVISAKRGVSLLGSVTAHLVLRDQVVTGHRQALEGNPDPRIVRIEGGWDGYRERLQLKKRGHAENIRDIVEAEHFLEIDLPDGSSSRLLNRRVRPARRDRGALIELTLSTALLPDYVQELQKVGKRGSRYRGLVPMLMELPPLVGRPNEHGAQLTLSMALVAHLRDHAIDLLEHRGVPLNLEVLGPMARRVGLPTHSVPVLLDRWAQDGTDAPALLKCVSPGRFTLGDAHARQREFLEDGARQRKAGQTAGRTGVQAHRAMVSRLGRSSRKS